MTLEKGYGYRFMLLSLVSLCVPGQEWLSMCWDGSGSKASDPGSGCVSETEIGAEFQKGVVACAGDHPHVRKMRSKKWAGRTVSSLNYW